MSCKMVGEVVHLESWGEGKCGVDSQWKWAPGFGQQEVNQTGGGNRLGPGGGGGAAGNHRRFLTGSHLLLTVLRWL